MTILALDTSSDWLSAAVVKDGQTLSLYHKNNQKTHSEFVMGAVDEVMQKSNLTLDDIDLFAVNKGPGSFTGIRIGLAIIKAFAHVKNKPVAAVDSLQSLCYYALPGEMRLLCPMIDARAGRVYTGLYRFENGRLTAIFPSCVLPVEELTGKIQEDTIYIGDGAQAYKDQLPQAAFTEHNECSAELIAKCALSMYHENKVSDYKDVSAFYIAIPQAERERLKKLEESK